MATPRLGLVVEDKPTELSCNLGRYKCTCTDWVSSVMNFHTITLHVT